MNRTTGCLMRDHFPETLQSPTPYPNGAPQPAWECLHAFLKAHEPVDPQPGDPEVRLDLPMPLVWACLDEMITNGHIMVKKTFTTEKANRRVKKVGGKT